MNHRIYDSQLTYHCLLRNTEGISLAGHYGHIDDTCLHFIRQNLLVTVEEQGAVTFTREDGTQLARTFVDPFSPKGIHGDCLCRFREGKILLLFARYDYIDTYPDCDGEYDRWIAREVGFQCLAYDVTSGEITLSKVETPETC